MKRDEDEEKLLPTASSSSNKQQSDDDELDSITRCLSFSRLTIESHNVFKTIQNFLKK